MQEFNNKMGTYILEEKDMNDRKRLYNREAGRKAIVNEVYARYEPYCLLSEVTLLYIKH